MLASLLALLPGPSQIAPAQAPAATAHAAPSQQDLAQLAARYGDRWTPEARAYLLAGPSVVSVQGFRKRMSALGGLAGRGNQLISQGTGVIIDSEGFVLTNAHVVAPDEHEADDQLACRISFSPDFGGASYDAQFLALDREWDLALLKIRSDDVFAALPLVAQDDLLIGERVIALGAPLGSSLSLTTGVLSGTGRDILVRGVQEVHKLSGVLQTDAAINPGNSGGPLLNALGQLIGINSATLTGAEGISYAIPAARVRQILETRLYSLHVWLGLGLVPNSLAVERLHPRGPAAVGGLRAGDLLTSLDGAPVSSSPDLQRRLILRHAGDTVRLGYARADGSVGSASVILAEEEMRWTLGVLGFTLLEDQLKIPVPESRLDKILNILRVDQVFPGSGAESLGLVSGDTLVAVRLVNGSNGDGWVPISSRAQLLELMRGGQLDFEGLNLWWLKSDGSSLKGRLTFDDPYLRTEAS